MKVTATDNLAKTLASTKKQVIGELKVPAMGIPMGLPIALDGMANDNVDAVDEAQLLLEAEKMLAKLMTKLAAEVEKALTEALKSSVWAWNGGARDIYDTGKLASSVSVTASSNGIKVSYSAPYANIVHNGGYIYPYGNKSARPIYLPPRPWVDAVLYGGGPVPQFDFEDFIERHTT